LNFKIALPSKWTTFKANSHIFKGTVMAWSKRLLTCKKKTNAFNKKSQKPNLTLPNSPASTSRINNFCKQTNPNY